MHEIKYNQPQFKSTFVNNKAYANICQYAKTQPDYKKFETVINELKKIGNHKIDISYGKVLEADETKPKPKKFTNELDYSCLKHNPLGWQEALYYKTMATFIKLKTGNDYMYISTFSKSFEPVELAYNAIMSLSNKTSNLFRFINNTPEECKKISAEEKELVNIIKTWNKENSDIFTKFKCLPHRYPNNDNKRLCDSMSILDYLQKIKESRLFDFDSKYMEKQAVLYDYNNLQQKLNQKQKSVSVNEIKEFLYKICSDDELRTKLAKEFSSEPRSGMKLKKILIDLLGGGQQGELLFNEWYFDEKSGYRKAYNDYYKHELYENATDLMTLVKQSPNIGT